MLKFVDISATTLTLAAGLEIKKYISNVIEKIKDQSKSPIARQNKAVWWVKKLQASYSSHLLASDGTIRYSKYLYNFYLFFNISMFKNSLKAIGSISDPVRYATQNIGNF